MLLSGQRRLGEEPELEKPHLCGLHIIIHTIALCSTHTLHVFIVQPFFFFFNLAIRRITLLHLRDFSLVLL